MNFHIKLSLVGLVILSFVACATAAPQAATNQPLEDLGAELLDSDALNKLLAPSTQNETKPNSKQPGLLPSVDEMRQLLKPNRQPPTDEDIVQQKEPPLVSIAGEMQRAGQLIASQDSTGETRHVQDAIVSELDKLIDKLNKQCQKCSGGKSKKPSKKQQSQASTPKPGAGKPSASQGSQSKPTASQISQGGGGEAQPGEAANADVVKKLWGQLPERLRQQLLQSSADEFLPKYREEIESYFRRLAEQQGSDR